MKPPLLSYASKTLRRLTSWFEALRPAANTKGRLRAVATVVAAAALGAITCQHAFPLDLGAQSWSHAPAKRLSVAFSAGSFTRFAMRVGGVAFKTVAEGKDGLVVTGLTYDRTAADGRRLKVTLTDPQGVARQVRADIFDWQLVPIARFVASDDDAAVTLFGELESEEDTRAKRREGYMVANYHPELENTLLGLRLLQADLLIFEPNAADLFSDKGVYVLGAGEKQPQANDIQQNAARYERVQQWQLAQPEAYQSYIVGDLGRKVTFSFVGDRLTLSGEPFWSCWRTDKARVDQVIPSVYSEHGSRNAYVLGVLGLLDEELDDLLTVEHRRVASLTDAAIDAQQAEIRARLESLALKAYAGTFRRIDKEFRKSNGSSLLPAQAVRQTLKDNTLASYKATIDSVYERFQALPMEEQAALVAEVQDLQLQADRLVEAVPVVQMQAYSERLSRKIKEEAGINPHVYAALKTTLTFSALFRHARQRNPEAYAQFVDSLASVKVTVAQPKHYRVVTPTLYPKDVARGQDEARAN